MFLHVLKALSETPLCPSVLPTVSSFDCSRHRISSLPAQRYPPGRGHAEKAQLLTSFSHRHPRGPQTLLCCFFLPISLECSTETSSFLKLGKSTAGSDYSKRTHPPQPPASKSGRGHTVSVSFQDMQFKYKTHWTAGLTPWGLTNVPNKVPIQSNTVLAVF